MTKSELNRNIKRLYSEIYRMSFYSSTEYFKFIENVAKPEFIRLFRADDKFEYMNLQSVKIMLRLNLSHRFIPLHTFGLLIEIEGNK